MMSSALKKAEEQEEEEKLLHLRVDETQFYAESPPLSQLPPPQVFISASPTSATFFSSFSSASTSLPALSVSADPTLIEEGEIVKDEVLPVLGVTGKSIEKASQHKRRHRGGVRQRLRRERAASLALLPNLSLSYPPSSLSPPPFLYDNPINDFSRRRPSRSRPARHVPSMIEKKWCRCHWCPAPVFDLDNLGRYAPLPASFDGDTSHPLCLRCSKAVHAANFPAPGVTQEQAQRALQSYMAFLAARFMAANNARVAADYRLF
jgi:hypothetical protein